MVRTYKESGFTSGAVWLQCPWFLSQLVEAIAIAQHCWKMPQDKPKGSCGEKEEEVDVHTVVVHLETHSRTWESQGLQAAWGEKWMEGKEAVGVNYTSQAAPGQESGTGTETCWRLWEKETGTAEKCSSIIRFRAQEPEGESQPKVFNHITKHEANELNICWFWTGSGWK